MNDENTTQTSSTDEHVSESVLYTKDIVDILLKENTSTDHPTWRVVSDKDMGENVEFFKAIDIIPLVRYVYSLNNDNSILSYSWPIWIQLKQIPWNNTTAYDLCIRSILVPDSSMRSILDQLSIGEKLSMVNSMNDNVVGGSLCYTNENFVHCIKTLLPISVDRTVLEQFILDYINYAIFHCGVTSFRALNKYLNNINESMEKIDILYLAAIDKEYAQCTEDIPYSTYWSRIVNKHASTVRVLILDIAHWQPKGTLNTYISILKNLQTSSDCTLMFYDSTITTPTEVENQINQTLYMEIHKVLVKYDPAETKEQTIETIKQYHEFVHKLVVELETNASTKDTSVSEVSPTTQVDNDSTISAE